MKTFIRQKKTIVIKQSVNKSIKVFTLLYTFFRDGDFYFLNILQQLKKKDFSKNILRIY